MSTLRLRWLDMQRYVGTDSWGNDVAIDGRMDSLTGAKPSDLLPLSLAACVAYTFMQILYKQRQEVTALEAEITSEQDPDPPWKFRRIGIAFVVRGSVDATKAAKALALSHEKNCSVSASLDPSVEQSYTVEVREGT